MSHFMRTLVGVVSLIAALGIAPPVAVASDPTPEERQQIEQIVHDYLRKHPELILEILKNADAQQSANRQEQTRSAIAAKRNELLNDPASPVGGNPEGDVTVVEFFDYQCPYCKLVEPAVEELIKGDAKLRIVYKEFPILGPVSTYASRVALAAMKQGKYVEFHTAMMAAKGKATEDGVMKIAADAGLDIAKVKADMSAPEIEQAIKHNYELADALRIDGTPTFVIGDTLLPGAADLATLKKTVAEARNTP